MDLKKIKLQLINQIMQTNDLEVLQTIQQILSLNNNTQAQTLTSQKHPFEEINRPVDKNLEEAAQELQDSIDEVFNL